MTANPYDAMRCLKDLPLTIVQQLYNHNFFKGPARNLRFKNLAFSEYFHPRGKSFLVENR